MKTNRFHNDQPFKIQLVIEPKWFESDLGVIEIDAIDSFFTDVRIERLGNDISKILWIDVAANLHYQARIVENADEEVVIRIRLDGSSVTGYKDEDDLVFDLLVEYPTWNHIEMILRHGLKARVY